MAILFDHLADQLTTPRCHTGVKNRNEAVTISWNQDTAQPAFSVYNGYEELSWHKLKKKTIFCVFSLCLLLGWVLVLQPGTPPSCTLLNMAAYINKVKTICLDFFFFFFRTFSPFLPPPWAEIHWLACSNGSVHDMLREDWELHWAPGKQGEFCFPAPLGTGPQHCLMSDRSQPGRLALFPCSWKKEKLLLTLRQGFLAWGGLHYCRFSCTWSHFFHTKLGSCNSPHKSEGTLLLPHCLTSLAVAM